MLSYSEKTNLPDEIVNYDILKSKVTELQDLIKQKINHFQDVQSYLEGYEKTTTSSKNNIRIRIENWKELYNKCNQIKDNYDKRIITRNLEK